MKRIFTVLAIVATIFAVSCKKEDPKKDDPKKDDPKEQTQEEAAPITIDGKFEDWGKLTDAFVAKNNPSSLWDAVKEIRVYPYGEMVYYYVRFDKEVIKEYLDNNDTFPARINLNTDGEFTSGYASYFNQAYDFIIEMTLANGAGGWGDAQNSTLFQRIDGSWTELSGEGSGLTFGAGDGYEFEIALDKAKFNAAASKSSIPMPMGDTFQTSMRFYETSTSGSWEELSNIPNSADGYGDLLEVSFKK